MSQLKVYTSSTAKITAENGEDFKADIMQTGEDFTEKLHDIRDSLRSNYWKLHDNIGKHSFQIIGDQIGAAAKLGELALALRAVEKAYSACSTVRCFTG